MHAAGAAVQQGCCEGTLRRKGEPRGQSRSPRPRRRWFVVRTRPSEMGTFASSLVDPKEERRQRHCEPERPSKRWRECERERERQRDVSEKDEKKEGSVERERISLAHTREQFSLGVSFDRCE